MPQVGARKKPPVTNRYTDTEETQGLIFQEAHRRGLFDEHGGELSADDFGAALAASQPRRSAAAVVPLS